MAKRVAAWTEGYFNPVVFHGPYGFGKTHLLNAIAWEAMRAAPHKKVIYLTAERFLSSFVKALMDRTGPAFKDELRAADLLLIDDVHFIAGKQSSQEELFHTLAALTQDGRRVVFTSDRAPTALTEMDARLRSHLQAGLVCGIEPADRTLRLGILERKLGQLSRQQGLSHAEARPEVLQFLADRFTDSVRELEGALNTLVAQAGERVSSLGLEEAQAMLRLNLRGGEKRITIDDIQKVCAEHYGMKQADLISERRNRSIARPRQAAMWLAKQLTTRSPARHRTPIRRPRPHHRAARGAPHRGAEGRRIRSWLRTWKPWPASYAAKSPDGLIRCRLVSRAPFATAVFG